MRKSQDWISVILEIGLKVPGEVFRLFLLLPSCCAVIPTLFLYSPVSVFAVFQKSPHRNSSFIFPSLCFSTEVLMLDVWEPEFSFPDTIPFSF